MSSSRDLPFKDRLRDPVREDALQRIWEGVEARFPHRHPRRRVPRLLAGAGLVTAGALAFVLAAHVRRAPGPLLLADGRPVGTVEAPATGAVLALADGSRVELAPGARLDPLESSSSSFIAILARGSAAFDVHPGGPRRWQIECGLATVEVVGTRFTCARRPGHLRVEVQRGAVLVRGERVADRARRLAAGEALDVADAASTAVAPPPPGAGAGAAAPAPVPSAPASASSTEVPATPAPGGHVAGDSSWRDLARGGRNDAAFAVLGPLGVRREAKRLGPTELFVLADVARLSGHPADAVAPLDRLLGAYPTDPQAPLAAFTLGRLDLEALDQPKQAAAALEKALALGIPRSLREDAQARLVEAYARAGDAARARAAAGAYARVFPGGRYTNAIETWCAGGPPPSRD